MRVSPAPTPSFSVDWDIPSQTPATTGLVSGRVPRFLKAAQPPTAAHSARRVSRSKKPPFDTGVSIRDKHRHTRLLSSARSAMLIPAPPTRVIGHGEPWGE